MPLLIDRVVSPSSIRRIRRDALFESPHYFCRRTRMGHGFNEGRDLAKDLVGVERRLVKRNPDLIVRMSRRVPRSLFLEVNVQRKEGGEGDGVNDDFIALKFGAESTVAPGRGSPGRIFVCRPGWPVLHRLQRE